MLTVWSVRLSSCGHNWESHCSKIQSISPGFGPSANEYLVSNLGSHSELEKKKRTPPIKPWIASPLIC